MRHVLLKLGLGTYLISNISTQVSILNLLIPYFKFISEQQRTTTSKGLKTDGAHDHAILPILKRWPTERRRQIRLHPHEAEDIIRNIGYGLDPLTLPVFVSGPRVYFI